MLVVEIYKGENPASVSFFDKFNCNFNSYGEIFIFFNFLVKKLKEKQKKLIIMIFQYLNIISFVYFRIYTIK